jgi:hypothetical protein
MSRQNRKHMNKLALPMLIALMLVLSSCAPYPVKKQEEQEDNFYAVIIAVHDGLVIPNRNDPLDIPTVIDVDLMAKNLDTMIGDPILKNHDFMDVDNCIGRVESAFVHLDPQTVRFTEDGEMVATKAIYVVARIIDKESIAKIKSGIYREVSISFSAIEEKLVDDNGRLQLVPTIVEFLEISVVAVPMDRLARIFWYFHAPEGMALSQLKIEKPLFEKAISPKVEMLPVEMD